MASNKEFVYTVKVQVKDQDGKPVEQTIQKTAKSLKDFEEGIGSLKQELQGADLGSEEFKKLNKELKDAEGKFEGAKIKAQGLGDSLTSIPGPIGQVAQGVKGLGTAFKALIANPVGLILAAIALALTALYKAFTSTKDGAEKMERVFAGLSAIVDVIRDRFLQLVKALASFDFKGIINSFTGIGEEMKNEAVQAANLKGKLQDLDDAQRELTKSRAETNAQIAEAKLRINDENLSYEERQKALEEVRNAEIKLSEQEAQLAKDRYDAIKAQNALSDSSKEALDAEAQAYVEMQNAMTASKAKQKELFDQEKSLRDRQRAESKAAVQEANANRKAVADFERQINLELITDEEEKQRRTLQISYEGQIEEINNLKTTTAKKNELKLKAQQDYDNKLKSYEDKLEEDRKKKEEEDRKKKEADEAAALQKQIQAVDNQIQLVRVQNEEELLQFKTLLNQKMELELSVLELTEDEKSLIREKYRDAELAADTTLAQQQEGLYNQQIKEINAGLDAVIAVAGEKSKVGKAAAIAQALINAYIAASEVLSAESVLPEPFGSLGKGVSAAAIFANAMQQVNAIRGIQTPQFSQGGMVRGIGGSYSDSITASVSNGEAVINSRSTEMFKPLLSAINSYGGGASFDANEIMKPSILSQSNQAPIKTYVVSRDMTSKQELDLVTKYSSTL